MRKKISPSQLKLLLEEEQKKEAEKKRWMYTQPCIYCGKELSLNSAGAEIGIHYCRVGRDMWAKAKVDDLLNNRQHNMLIHGFLMAIQSYVIEFGLHNTAVCIIQDSGIAKEDLIRCQVQSNWKSETMLPLIERAFAL